MATIEALVWSELLTATDKQIESSIQFADPMVLRGLLYQITGDPELTAIKTHSVMRGYYWMAAPVDSEDGERIRKMAVDFLKAYRDSGGGPISLGPLERLPKSLELLFGESIPQESIDLYLEDLAIDPWARSLRWRGRPDPEQLAAFTVTVIGAGMGGLNAALMLKRAGIPYFHIEKNGGVGGTWHENRYPGARVDTPSRSYAHIFGVGFDYPNPFCEWIQNQRYFDWVADEFGLRENIRFNTEVLSMNWDEKASVWEIRMRGLDGECVLRSRAVITAIGFLNRPNIPKNAGAATFKGQSWHTARWPGGVDLSDKRVAVIGTGCTGYQVIPELALVAKHVTVFQRTPQWIFSVPGYRSPFPPQVMWLDHNVPLHRNFMRARSANNSWFARLTTIDKEFGDAYACSKSNRAARDSCISFLERKIADPALRKVMTPKHPVWSARAVVVDPEYSILDAIQRSNVTLVSAGIDEINSDGILDYGGVQHDADVIVYATGFLATEYLYPMEITGRDGRTLKELWSAEGARAYMGSMIPNFPNLWMIYGPNTNGALPVAAFHEMVTLYALQCIEKLILEKKSLIEVKDAPYCDYNKLIDERNATKVWSDPRASNYYWSKYGRSVVQNPFGPTEMWRYLCKPNFDDLAIK
jgi:4-hydroxyacetophenone monooxygenase